jgi:hypothetical protein
MKWLIFLLTIILLSSQSIAEGESSQRFLLSKVLFTQYLWGNFLDLENVPSLKKFRLSRKAQMQMENKVGQHFYINGSWRKFLNDPRPFFPLISEASSKTGVPESVLAAVAACESSFLPNAVSHAGAVGLMQIMPQNFRLLGVLDPYNPRQSVMGGAKFLRRLYLKTGSWWGALASYNCGLGCWRRNKVPRVTIQYIRCAFGQYMFFKKYGPWRS